MSGSTKVKKVAPDTVMGMILPSIGAFYLSKMTVNDRKMAFVHVLEQMNMSTDDVALEVLEKEFMALVSRNEGMKQ